MNLDYKVLKSNILKCCRSERESTKFIVNYDKLSHMTKSIGLTMVNVGTKSKEVDPSDVIYLSEYFKGQRLSWISEYKQFTTLVFIQSEYINDKAEKLLDIINSSIIDNPDIDKIKAMSTLIAEFPVYFATVISYMSNDPQRYGKASYEIKCRANLISIQKEDYKYNSGDM